MKKKRKRNDGKDNQHITTTNSVDDIKNNIEYLNAKRITLEKEFSFLIDEIRKEQQDYKQKYQIILSQGELKSQEYKKDLNSKKDDLKKLKDGIDNNNHGNELLNNKISENKKTIKEISNKILSFRKSMESFKEKAQKIDKETFQESEKSALNFSESTEERRKFTEFVIDLTETNPIHDNIQKNWDELWENYNKLIKEKEKEQATLETEISNWEEQIQINQNKIKEKNMK